MISLIYTETYNLCAINYPCGIWGKSVELFPKKLGNSKIMAPRNIIYSNNASFDLNIPGLLGEHRLPFQT